MPILVVGRTAPSKKYTRHDDLLIRHEFVFCLPSGKALCEQHLTHRSYFQCASEKLKGGYRA
jgi:hypothetical protein